MKSINKKAQRITAESGFSLVEMVLIVVVAGIVIASVLPFTRISIQSYVGIKAQKDIMQSARIGFNRMIAEMNEIESSIQIDSGTETSIQFDLPVQNDIIYSFTNGTLQRQGVLLVRGVQKLAFRYFLEDGTQKVTPFGYDSDVWRIQIEMVVGNEETHMVYRGSISPRNLHYE
jgi:type II secretory pathway pseudopilin PulG